MARAGSAKAKRHGALANAGGGGSVIPLPDATDLWLANRRQGAPPGQRVDAQGPSASKRVVAPASPELRVYVEEYLKRGSESSASSGSEHLQLHGNGTDVVHGRAMAASFFVSALCAILLGAISLFIYLGGAGEFYSVGWALVTAVGRNPIYWSLIVWLPLGAGSVLCILSILMMVFALLSVEQAERVSSLARGACGQGVHRHMQSKFGGCNKCLVYGIKVLALAFVVIQVVISIVALGLLDELDQAVREGRVGSTSGATENVAHAKVLGFQVAVFNECCAARGWSNQGTVPRCDPEVPSDTKAACPLPTTLNLYRSALCTCYDVSEEEYEWFLQQVRDRDVCGILEDATVAVPRNERVPGTPLSVRTFLDAPEARLVGDPAAGDHGCGAGLARGFQWLLYRWLVARLKPVTVAALLISIVQFFAISYGIYANHAGIQSALITKRIREQEEEERVARRRPARPSTRPALPGLSRPSSADLPPGAAEPARKAAAPPIDHIL